MKKFERVLSRKFEKIIRDDIVGGYIIFNTKRNAKIISLLKREVKKLNKKKVKK